MESENITRRKREGKRLSQCNDERKEDLLTRSQRAEEERQAPKARSFPRQFADSFQSTIALSSQDIILRIEERG